MPPQQPQAPNQYDFILNKPQQAGVSKLGFLANLPRPALILLGIVGLLVVVILLAAAFGGGGAGGQQQMLSAAARATEIARVSGVVLQQPADSDTKALAATTQTTLTSEVQDITGYLQSNGTKVDPKTLGTYQDSSADSQMQTAAQNNNISQTYSAYLKAQLNDYSGVLSSAYKSAGPQGKQVLDNAYTSVQNLLSAPQLANP